MQDKKSEKQPSKVSDSADEVESDAERIEKKNRSRVPLYLKNTRSASQGNQQDEKDETPE